jgi:hypothetical protein
MFPDIKKFIENENYIPKWSPKLQEEEKVRIRCYRIICDWPGLREKVWHLNQFWPNLVYAKIELETTKFEKLRRTNLMQTWIEERYLWNDHIKWDAEIKRLIIGESDNGEFDFEANKKKLLTSIRIFTNHNIEVEELCIAVSELSYLNENPFKLSLRKEIMIILLKLSMRLVPTKYLNVDYDRKDCYYGMYCIMLETYLKSYLNLDKDMEIEDITEERIYNGIELISTLREADNLAEKYFCNVV